MSEELGKIEKPAAEEFKKGRRLYFVPLVYCGKEPEPEYRERYSRYWAEVELQIGELELRLGRISRIYHELVPAGGEQGIKAIKELNERSCQVIEVRVGGGAQLEATEEAGLLTEFMDWTKCLTVGLQNQKVVVKVYESYLEAGRKRNEYIARKIDETLKPDEIGIVFMREGHQVQFPPDIQVFYVAPPSLDDIKRWVRDREAET
jgi:hypothetical protein